MANPFKELAAGIADLSQLQVQTYTGNITAHIADGDGGGSIINWQERLTTSATENGDVSLVAATKVNFDGIPSFSSPRTPVKLFKQLKQVRLILHESQAFPATI